jgi:hypothetical protein
LKGNGVGLNGFRYLTIFSSKIMLGIKSFAAWNCFFFMQAFWIFLRCSISDSKADVTNGIFLGLMLRDTFSSIDGVSIKLVR